MKANGRATIRSVPMSIMPVKGESFPGYIVRVADWNVLDDPRELLGAVELRVGNSRDFSGLSQLRIRRFAEVVGVGYDEINALFHGTYSQGVPPEWLRHKRPMVGRQLLDEAGFHRASWMLSPISFCPETWTHHLHICAQCGRQFDWIVVASRACVQCERRISESDFSAVPSTARASLHRAVDWLGLQIMDVEEASPPLSQRLVGLTKGHLFQLAVLFGRALAKQNAAADLRRGQGVSLTSELSKGVEAVIHLDEFLADISPLHKNKGMPPFFRQLAQSKRLVPGPVEVLLGEILAPFYREERGVQRLKAEREKAGKMTATQLAQKLKIEKSTLKSLVERKKIETAAVRGKLRRHVWFNSEQLQQGHSFIESRISAHIWSRAHSVKTIEMIQLVDAGLLEVVLPTDALDPSKVELARKGAEATVADLMSKAVLGDGGRQWFRLDWLFKCLGAAHKPWGAVLWALKQGRLDGEILSTSMTFSPRALHLQKDLAVAFRQSVLNGERPLFCSSPPEVEEWYPLMARGEVANYLNVSSAEVTWLARKGHLGTNTVEGFMKREDVEELGARCVGTREISVLAGRSTASVRGLLERCGLSPVMPDVPFWRRSEVIGKSGAIHQIALSAERWPEWSSLRR